MNWHTETPSHDKSVIFAQIFAPCEEECYWFSLLCWAKKEMWNDDTEQFDDCWVSASGAQFTDDEIFAWIPMSDIEQDCNDVCQLNIKQLVKERNL